MNHPRQAIHPFDVFLALGWHAVAVLWVPTLSTVGVTVKHEKGRAVASQPLQSAPRFLNILA